MSRFGLQLRLRTAVKARAKRHHAYHGLMLARYYLKEEGWGRSMIERESLDNCSDPIPWLTYPATRFLRSRLPQGLRVFEYGCGNSTLWWAARCNDLVSCEHDRSWFQRMAPTVPENCHLALRTLGDGSYASEILNHGLFDVVVVDGRERVRCAETAVSSLTGDGILIWDDSDRPRYQAGIEAVEAQGFRRVDFYGMRPLSYHGNMTSILYRPGSNVLNL